MWSNPPAYISALRTQLAACASWVAWVTAPLASTNVHFPVANPAGANGTTATKDALPLAVLFEGQAEFAAFAPAASPLRSGVLEIDLLGPVSTGSKTVGELETLAAALISELHAQWPGSIPFLPGASFQAAREPDPGARASDTSANPQAYRSVRIRLPYGLNA